MPQSDAFDFGKLTKEMVASRLQEVQNAPSVAADIVKATIVAGVKGTAAWGQDPRQTVAGICEGAMRGLLLIDKDLPAAAGEILARLAGAAQEAALDPQELMTWALEGMARVAPVVPRETVWRMREAIDRRFMGVGEVFDKLCKGATT